MDTSPLVQAADVLRRARRVVVMTGAGVSAESGLSTFRDPEEGLWSRYDPMELATIDAFHRDPSLVTRWYHWRFVRARDCRPNPAHDALARLQREVQARGGTFTLLTQNVDGLHQRAGSTGVIELHGTIMTWRCTRTGQSVPLDRVSFDEYPVRSAHGGLLRPNVVWFGESLPEDALRAAYDAVMGCDAYLNIGTSAVVQPAAGFVLMARDLGGTTVEINPDATPVTPHVDLVLRGKAGQVVPELVGMAFGPG